MLRCELLREPEECSKRQGWWAVVGKPGHSGGRAGVVPLLWEACQVAHGVHEDSVAVHRPLRTPLCRGGAVMR